MEHLLQNRKKMIGFLFIIAKNSEFGVISVNQWGVKG